MATSELKQPALLMAVNCVRNTVIEKYHSEGKLIDLEMMAFNREVADKLYTFLHFIQEKPSADRAAFLEAAGTMYPHDWDEPQLDRDLTKAAAFIKRHGNPFKAAAVPKKPAGSPRSRLRPTKKPRR
jgi:hypothetical protein